MVRRWTAAAAVWEWTGEVQLTVAVAHYEHAGNGGSAEWECECTVMWSVSGVCGLARRP